MYTFAFAADCYQTVSGTNRSCSEAPTYTTPGYNTSDMTVFEGTFYQYNSTNTGYAGFEGSGSYFRNTLAFYDIYNDTEGYFEDSEIFMITNITNDSWFFN